MKTQISGRTPVGRRVGVLLMTLVLLALAGCVVTSIYPFYTEKDLVSNPSLLGKWAEAEATNPPSEYVTIEPLGTNAFWATIFTRTETNACELHLFRLGQQLFMDEFSTNRSLDYVPIHQVSKIIRVEPTLQTASLNYDWIARLLEKHPRAIRHIVLPEKPGDKHGRIVLTADTSDLQHFLLKYLNNTNAWNKPSEMKRVE